MRSIQLLFYRAREQGDHLMNRVVSWFDPPFVHVEIRFEDGMASSIFAGEPLFFRQRTFANPNYHVETLTVEPSDYNSMYRFCQERARQGIRFDNLGMYLAILPLLSFTPPHKTFCSRHVTETLHIGNVPEFVMLTPHKTTPSMLYKAVKSSTHRFFSSVPFKINMVTQTDPPPNRKREANGEVGVVSFRRPA